MSGSGNGNKSLSDKLLSVAGITSRDSDDPSLELQPPNPTEGIGGEGDASQQLPSFGVAFPDHSLLQPLGESISNPGSTLDTPILSVEAPSTFIDSEAETLVASSPESQTVEVSEQPGKGSQLGVTRHGTRFKPEPNLEGVFQSKRAKMTEPGKPGTSGVRKDVDMKKYCAHFAKNLDRLAADVAKAIEEDREGLAKVAQSSLSQWYRKFDEHSFDFELGGVTQKHMNEIWDKYKESSSQLAEFLDRKSLQKDKTNLIKIKLPDFHGVPEEYVQWRQMFDQQIHENPNLDEINKFAHLRASLKGKAFDFLKKTAFSNDSYDKCLEYLDEKYRKRADLDVSIYMKKLRDFRFVGNDAKGRRECYDTLNSIWVTVQSLDPSQTERSSTIVTMLDDRIFDKYKDHWNQFKLRQRQEAPDGMFNPTMKEFLSFINSQIEIEETEGSFKDSKKEKATAAGKKNGVAFNTESHPKKRTEKGKGKGPSPSPKKSPKKGPEGQKKERGSVICHVCGEKGHFRARCVYFRKLSVAERKKLIASKGLCHKCLANDHASSACPKDMTCVRCNRHHHFMLCD